MVGWDEKIKKDLKYCGENVYIGLNEIFTNPKEVCDINVSGTQNILEYAREHNI